MGRFEQLKREWDNEVEEEACRLVEEGVPPYTAMVRARIIIERRRSENAMRKGANHGR